MMKPFQKILVIAAAVMSVGFLMTVNVADAQTTKTTTKPSAATAKTDPCAKLQDQIGNGGFNVNGNLPVYCSTGSVYNKIINGALYAIGIAATIAIIFGGYLYMTAGANEEQRKKGRTVLTWAVVGVAVVVVAALLVNVVIKFIVT